MSDKDQFINGVFRNIFKEDIVKFQNKEFDPPRLDYGIVAKLPWDEEDLDDEEEEDEKDGEEEGEEPKKKKKEKDDESDNDENDEEEDDGEEDDEEDDEEDGEEEEEEEDDDDDEDDDIDDRINTYKFKNNNSGVLLQKISGGLLELDLSEITLVDRTLYLGDTVQKNNTDSKQLGKVLKSKRKYAVVPFSVINKSTLNNTIQNGFQDSIIYADKVRPPTEYIYDVLVLDKSKKVIGSIVKEKQELKIQSLSDPSLIGNFDMSKLIKVEGYYDEFVCKGKQVTSARGNGLILDVMTKSIDINWYFYIDMESDVPAAKQSPSDVILLADDYDYSIIGESILYKDENNVDQGGMVLYTDTDYIILWQDGTTTEESSLSLSCVYNLATDYFPGDAIEPAEKEKKIKWGVIKQYDPEKRTCSIYWKYNDAMNDNIVVENDVSVYLIEYLEDDNFDESDFVFRKDDEKMHPSADVVGQVIGKVNESCQLRIRWNNGFEELVYPKDLSVIEEQDSDDENDDDDQDEYYFDDVDRRKDNGNSVNGKSANENRPGVFNQMKSIFYKIKDDVETLRDNICHGLGIDINNHHQYMKHSKDHDEGEEEGDKQQEEEKGEFELLTSIDNHAFYNEKSIMSSKFLKVISNEFELLQSSLPKGIYVKGFSQRMNLLQALIIGPSDTVYENGVFIFDIYLPSQYPYVPPKVFYHSVTFKLHPNLYVNGNVCLSLLGTWHGNKNEVWQPGLSNLLQVLISIQGLILGSKEPYFLEAGYESQIGTKIGNRNSSLYNEEAYLLTLEALLFYHSNKPSIFADIITKHINDKKQEILDRIDQFFVTPKSTNSNDSNNENNNNNNNSNSSEKLNSIFGIQLPPTEGFVLPLLKSKNKLSMIENK